LHKVSYNKANNTFILDVNATKKEDDDKQAALQKEDTRQTTITTQMALPLNPVATARAQVGKPSAQPEVTLI
jgi:hypothetical protein